MTDDATPAPVPSFIYGTAWKEDDTRRCVEEALDAGFRGIDTAGQPRHYHEPGIGAALDNVYGRGELTRDDLFLQTKFTPPGGQGKAIPYDPTAPIPEQVEASFRRSLENLRTARLDSYLLHGPSDPRTLTAADREVWRALEAIHARGGTRFIGVSNVRLAHLRGLCEEAEVMPAFVQNRCFARTAWDREIRDYCRDQGIVYQGFSLLTANVEALRDPRFAEIARRHQMTPAQVVFGFARQVGILPLTGTTDRAHMDQDLRALELDLAADEIEVIETLALA